MEITDFQLNIEGLSQFFFLYLIMKIFKVATKLKQVYSEYDMLTPYIIQLISYCTCFITYIYSFLYHPFIHFYIYPFYIYPFLAFIHFYCSISLSEILSSFDVKFMYNEMHKFQVYITGTLTYPNNLIPYQGIVQYHYPKMFLYTCSQSLLARTLAVVITVTVLIFSPQINFTHSRTSCKWNYTAYTPLCKSSFTIIPHYYVYQKFVPFFG